MRKKVFFCMGILSITCLLVSCSNVTSSKSPLGALAEIAKMYDGLSSETFSYNKGSETQKNQVKEADEKRKEVVSNWKVVEVPTMSFNESIEIVEPVKIVSTESGPFKIIANLECKVKLIDSVPKESNISSNGLRGFKIIGCKGDTFMVLGSDYTILGKPICRS